MEDLEGQADGLPIELLHNDLVGAYIIQDGRFSYVNRRFAALFGYSEAELCHRLGMIDLSAPGCRSLVNREIERCVRESNSCRYSFDGLRKDGSTVLIDAFGTRTEFDGRAAIIGMTIDTSERRKAELEIMGQLHFTEQLVNAIPNPVFYKDEHGRYLGCNRAFELYLGKTREDILGKSVYELAPTELADRYYAADKALFDSPGVQTYEAAVQSADGTCRDVLFYKATFNKFDGCLGGLVGVIFDITERKRSERAVWREANYDQLTQLPNRRLFLEQLQAEMEQTNRSASMMALMLIDLDRFKAVNDTFGHETGDQLLVEATRRIAGCVRESGTIARLGGDEFAVVLCDISEEARAGQVACSIIWALEQPFHLGVEVAYVSASVGITFYPTDAKDIDALLRSADQAMYDAKTNGRSRFSYFMPEMQAAVIDRLQIGNDLRHAVAQSQLEVYYQPVIELSSGRIVKAEALLRWKHPKRGMISPAQFIPIAEDLGLINEIGDWVFKQAVSAAKQFADPTGCGADHAGGVLQVSVNKSPRQFLTGNTHETWIEYLQQVGLPGEYIGIEITEGLLLDARQDVLEKLERLRCTGIQVSLDDFGTGYSAMAYLKRFHIDYLKIDRSFICDMVRDPNDCAIIEAIVAMAHKLGIRVVAEGIETEEQLNLLTSMGCDYWQGYLFSKPVPQSEFLGLLRQEERQRRREIDPVPRDAASHK